MTIVWEQRKQGSSVVKQMLMTVGVSGLVSMACTLYALREHREPQHHAEQLERKAIRTALSALESRLHTTTLVTTKLQHDFALLTAENGIIGRVIAHLQTIRVENAALSQHLASLQAGTLPVLAGTASAEDGPSVESRSRRQDEKPAVLTVVTPAPQQAQQNRFSSRSAAAGVDGAAIKARIRGG
ncbi:hypothetical protein QBD00_003464 [Ochrobactrum sp. AN78]|nr:hypothetical protein [Ochrobactrum sp. AN78]